MMLHYVLLQPLKLESRVPPEISVNPAAAIAEETPISALQPPIAAEMVAFFLKVYQFRQLPK